MAGGGVPRHGEDGVVGAVAGRPAERRLGVEAAPPGGDGAMRLGELPVGSGDAVDADEVDVASYGAVVAANGVKVSAWPGAA